MNTVANTISADMMKAPEVGEIFTFQDRSFRVTKVTPAPVHPDDLRPWLEMPGFNVEGEEVRPGEEAK